MFDSLKKKISGWFTKPAEKPKKAEKATKKAASAKKEVKKEVKKVIPKKEVKKEKVIKRKRTSRELEDERKVSANVIQDIKKETGKEEITSIPQVESESKEEVEEEKPEEEQQTTDIEEETEEKKPQEGFFSKLFKKITPLGTVRLEEKQIDEIFAEIEMTLLENNVALAVLDKIREILYKDLVGISVKKDEIEASILGSLKKSIDSVLIEPPNLTEAIEKSLEPYVILFFGINGSGKTTSIAKLAYNLKKQGISVVLAAGDTFRAASIEQLETHANKIGVPIVKHDYGSDPAAVAFDAIAYAKKNKIKAVLIDTAGRMYTKANLLKEMEKIVKVSKPNLKIFVGESITGNDATEQAKTFNETAGIDGIILSKADVDEKAGTILSVSYVTSKPIYFLGVGQEYGDLQPFTKKDVMKGLGLE